MMGCREEKRRGGRERGGEEWVRARRGMGEGIVAYHF
jgi:hypothetical protein